MTNQDSALILIVDDDDVTRIHLRQLMEYAGYRVVEASNGCQAITTYTNLHPDMVIIDAIMPVMDGFTCCEKLQKLPDIQDTPILMITAAYEPASVERAFAAGATDYITKPIQWVVLSHRIRRLLAASRAIKQLRQQNQQAQLRETQMKIALEAARMGTWDWNIITNQVSWSDNKEALFGLEPGSFDGRYETFLHYVHPQDRDFVNISVIEAVQTDAEYDVEFRIVLADGSIRWLVSKGVVFRNAAGEPVRMSGIVIDITKRKQAEAELRQSEERFQIITRATNDVIWDWDLLTNQVWWNQAVQTLFGYPLAELSADLNWWYERIHPEDQPIIDTDMWAAINSGQQFWSHEYRFRRYDGSYAYILDRAYIVHDQAGQPVRMIGAMMDITERKRVQAQLQWQNLRSQLFADITVKIRQSLQIDEILQTSVTEVQKLLRADRVLILRLRSNGSILILKEAVVPGLPMASSLELNEPTLGEMYVLKYSQGIINTISNLDDEQEAANISPPHLKIMQELGVKAVLSVPIFLQNQIWGLLIANQCVYPRQWNNWEIELLQQLADQIGIALTQSKILETETRQRQELSRSNEALQEFAFIASHDLQEPLRKIKTFSERLLITCGDSLPEAASDYLERMQNAVLRMQTLIEGLLTLSRVTTRAQPFVSVSLAEITQEVLSDLEVLIQQTGATVEVEDLPTIKADPLQMRQLMQNLIGNALKFHPPQMTPIVKIYSQHLNNQSAQLAVGLEFCQIIIEDNGIGFEQKYSDRIFQIFQRLHGRREYEGTGIGLTICRKIAERHFGTITAQSTPGKGTKLIVNLPINSPT
ncbi:PAS domain-containing protein [Nostoc sp. FACHB-87]|uniref:PAS domain-containing protein n=1 Tax=Nostocaceae TaxID=1162 RepID=UPI001686A052|nr:MULTISPECIES: PAS domain-containing protein [Nostocaceae]MBD2458221.1 PAS domain-containing protein [Nostoc sp. FACHB-87]MBD2480077.1 PAS domain-containing protein [Anabaena sp. FACHB-83]